MIDRSTSVGPQHHGGDIQVFEALRQVASWGLPGGPVTGDLPASLDLESLLAATEAHRLLGPLHWAAVLGEVELPGPLAAHLADRHQVAMAWCLQLELRLLDIHEQFVHDDVRHVVLKGSALAHLDEPDPSMRSFADLDLLIADADLDRAVAILESGGATRSWPERRPGYDRRFAKSVTLTGPDGIEVDLHRALCDGVFGVRLPLAELFEQTEPFEVGGTTLRALAPAQRVVHSAYHAVLGSPRPRLMSLRDLAQGLCRRDLTVEDVVATSQRWGGEAVLAEGVRAAFEQLTFDAPAWSRWLDERSIDRRELALVADHRREGSSFGPAKLDAWRELAGARAKCSYAVAVGWPTRAHLRARGLRRRDLLASVVDLARSRVRR